MKLTFVLTVTLVLAFGSTNAEVITPHSNISNACGSKIKTADVMVLDLESFGKDHAAARAFTAKHAGEFFLGSITPELIQTKMQGIMYTRKSAIKRATKEAANRGCDLLLILAAGTENVGTAYFNKSNSTTNTTGTYNSNSFSAKSNTSGNSFGSGTDVKKGGAVVLMGDREK